MINKLNAAFGGGGGDTACANTKGSTTNWPAALFLLCYIPLCLIVKQQLWRAFTPLHLKNFTEIFLLKA